MIQMISGMGRRAEKQREEIKFSCAKTGFNEVQISLSSGIVNNTKRWITVTGWIVIVYISGKKFALSTKLV